MLQMALFISLFNKVWMACVLHYFLKRVLDDFYRHEMKQSITELLVYWKPILGVEVAGWGGIITSVFASIWTIPVSAKKV
jgi:hypothetical protein